MDPKFKFVRVAAVSPKVTVGNVEANVSEISCHINRALNMRASIIVFPELALTGYTLGDLLLNEVTQQAVNEALKSITASTQGRKGIVIVGAPIHIGTALTNSAVIISQGKILAVIPKCHLPNYKEFYDKRWFVSGFDIDETEVMISGSCVPFGTDIMIESSTDPDIRVAVEICEDLWMATPPSSLAAISGATILCNPSASNELVGKASYRKELVAGQSARTNAAYVYASSGIGESSMDVVFGGHCLVAELGSLLTESKRFGVESIVFADIDIGHIVHERQKTNSFSDNKRMFKKMPAWRMIRTDIPVIDSDAILQTGEFFRHVTPHPFLPASNEKKKEVCEEIFAIQVAGLVKRLEQSEIEHLVLGLSGGLDSTLAFLVGLKALAKLGLPAKNLIAVTMPGFGTTGRTKSNATLLAEHAGVTFMEIPINASVTQHLADIKHDGVTEDVTFENAQARTRTLILMDIANQVNGLVLGTGDLSEAALGWCTYNGDHISHYGINCGVPKTLVRYVVTYAATVSIEEISQILNDILDTPVSPELLSAGTDGQIAQKTEDVIGPYELHDFFLYHFIRWGSSPRKIAFLTMVAFKEKYDAEAVSKWLGKFIRRFFTNQWKRSAVPDGPKVGSVALSPRGDWRMPSDAELGEWRKGCLLDDELIEMRQLALRLRAKSQATE